MSRSDGPVPRVTPAGAPADRSPQSGSQGCLVQAIRVPVRIFAFAVVVPLRFLWELLVLAARPVGAALGWAGRMAGRLAYWLLVRPLVALYRHVLTPLGRGLARAGAWAGRAARWLAYWLLVRPFVALWRRVLLPVLRFLRRYLLVPFGAAVVWLGAGLVRLVVGTGRVLRRLFDVLVVVPARWLRKYVLAPFAAGLGWLGAALVGLIVGTGRVLRRLFDVLVVVPAWWLRTYVLAPAARGLIVAGIAVGRALLWLVEVLLTVVVRLVEYLVLWPLRALGRYVVAPAGRAVVWLLRVFLVIPLGLLWRTLLHPVLRGLGRAIAWAWHLGGRIWRYLVVRPCQWLRREVWWPVKEELRLAVRSARETMREVRRSLLG